MAVLPKVDGVAEVINRLRQTHENLGNGVARGLKKAGLFLQRESQGQVPVHLGPLKASAFTRAFGKGFKTDVVVGYTAKYAVFVHEDLEAAHGKEFNVKHADKIANAHTPAQKKMWFNRGENQQAKFLERPAREKAGEIIQIIADEAVKQ